MSSLCLVLLTFVLIFLSVTLQGFMSSVLLFHIYCHLFQTLTLYPQDLIRLQLLSVVKIKFVFFGM